jgi:Bacterial tandem repeat domain 1
VDPQGQADSSGFSVGYFGGGGDDAEVTFVLLSGKCVVDSSSGEIACTQSMPLVSSQQRYAAIWERRGGFSWQARHGLTSAQYQQAFDQLLKDGYRVVLVNGYSVGNEDRYAAIWEQ